MCFIQFVNFSPKRLVCSQDFYMACPVPSFPDVLVNRSLLCNCHLESGLTYVLKSLGSCLPKHKFTTYFSINSAFNHYMSTFSFSSKDVSPKKLFTHQPIFDIFLNTSLKPMLIYNKSSPTLPLNPLTPCSNCFNLCNPGPLYTPIHLLPYCVAYQ